MRKSQMDPHVFDMLRTERDRCIQAIEKLTGEIDQIVSDLAVEELDRPQPAVMRREKLEADLELQKKRRDTIRYILKKCTVEP